MLRVTRLFTYPIKSCRPIETTEMAIGRRGPVGDRRFMIVDADGKFVSQREDPMLCLVDVTSGDDAITLIAHGRSITVPRAPSEGPRARVKVWSSEVEAIEVDEGSAFFTEHLGRPVRLVYMPDESERPVNPKRAKPGDLVSFADGYPLLMISEESLAGLNDRLDTPLEMQRFRPNVVIAGGAAHDEDELGRFRIGDVSFRNVKKCDRCSVTTVDPATGERGKQPLKALADYRKWDGQVWFGTNLIHDGDGTIRVGDALELL